MILYEMNDLEAACPVGPERIFIPGGWKARIPQVRIDPQSKAAFIRVLKNEAAVDELHQRIYTSGYLAGLRLAIARRAQLYSRLFPDLREPLVRRYKTSKRYVTLYGFDPEYVQSTYIPYDLPGRRGNETITDILNELGERARENRRRQ